MESKTAGKGAKGYTLEAINERLKAACNPVRVMVRAKTALYLRASLPPKPGKAGVGKRQTDVPLGRSGSKEGLKFAEAEAMRMGSLLALGRFSWEEWGYSAKVERQSIAEVVGEFKEHYLATHDISIDTWVNHWDRFYRLLPQEGQLSERLLLDVVLRFESTSWMRRQAVMKLQRLAEFAKLEINLQPYKGTYGHRSVKRRELPSDQEVAQWRERVTAADWRWFYGMMAAYGLRPYEPWFCEFEESSDELLVTIGKKTAKKTTEPRYVKPLYPEWVKQWELRDIQRPKINTELIRIYSARAVTAFKRFGIPFPPKTLRHCYAVRSSIVFKMSPDTAAGYMGHDVTVHCQTYKRWLTKTQRDWEYQRVVSDPNRPAAPSI